MPDKPELFDWDDTDFCPADASHDVLYMGVRKYVAADTMQARIEAAIREAARADDISDGAAQWCIDTIRDQFAKP